MFNAAKKQLSVSIANAAKAIPRGSLEAAGKLKNTISSMKATIKTDLSEENAVLKIKNTNLTSQNDELMKKFVNMMPKSEHEKIMSTLNDKLQQLKIENVTVVERSKIALSYDEFQKYSGQNEMKSVKDEIEKLRQEIKQIGQNEIIQREQEFKRLRQDIITLPVMNSANKVSSIQSIWKFKESVGRILGFPRKG